MPSLRPAFRPVRPFVAGVLPLIAALVLGAVPQGGLAQESPAATAEAGIAALSDALRIREVMEVMREEGLQYGETLEADMFPGSGGAAWQAKVSAIYDADAMVATFNDALTEALSGEAATARVATEFFASPLGQKVVRLEIEARRALLDEVAEGSAQLGWADMEGEDDPRADLIRRFAEVNDLIDSNVTGALNSNLAFYRGLAGAGLMGEMPQEDMLAEVWAQEEAVRAETEDWLYPYLALAYRPLSDAELTAYIEFSATPEGQGLNRALFSAFAVLFERISAELGAAAAIQLQGQDI